MPMSTKTPVGVLESETVPLTESTVSEEVLQDDFVSGLATPTSLKPFLANLTERYVLKEIGSGGQGRLYLATDRESGAVLALKRQPISQMVSVEQIQRYEDGVRALQNINHPHVVAYHDSSTRIDEFGSPELWVMMEYVQGGSLADAWQVGRRFNENELRSLAGQTLEGLAAAHEKGIIHRDVKPANILLTEDDEVKITDFGIAKFLGERTRDSSIIGKGTLAYMAPEQFNPALSITPATDYYGLGITLLELATGKLRTGAYFQDDPQQDLNALRSSGYLSEQFVDGLELLIDQHPEKRREGAKALLEKPQLEQVVQKRAARNETEYRPEYLTKYTKIIIGGIGFIAGALGAGSIAKNSDELLLMFAGGCLGAYSAYRASFAVDKLIGKLVGWYQKLKDRAASKKRVDFNLRLDAIEQKAGLREKEKIRPDCLEGFGGSGTGGIYSFISKKNKDYKNPYILDTPALKLYSESPTGPDRLENIIASEEEITSNLESSINYKIK